MVHGYDFHVFIKDEEDCQRISMLLSIMMINKNHCLAFNTKTLTLWWYKWDIDPLEEWAKEGSYESVKEKLYKEHIEKVYDVLCGIIDSKIKDYDKNDSHHARSTLYSTAAKHSASNLVNGKYKHIFNNLYLKQNQW